MTTHRSTKNPRATGEVIFKIKDALEHAAKLADVSEGSDRRIGVEREAREAAHLYVLSWIIDPLQEALNLAEGRSQYDNGDR